MTFVATFWKKINTCQNENGWRCEFYYVQQTCKWAQTLQLCRRNQSDISYRFLRNSVSFWLGIFIRNQLQESLLSAKVHRVFMLHFRWYTVYRNRIFVPRARHNVKCIYMLLEFWKLFWFPWKNHEIYGLKNKLHQTA